MYVKQKYADELFEATSKTFAKKGIHNVTDPGYIDAFQEQLSVMARESKYKEGEKIKPGDLTLLKDTLEMIFKDMKEGIVEQRMSLAQMDELAGLEGLDADQYPEQLEALKNKGELAQILKKGKLSASERFSYDPCAAMVAVNDYLYAMAMKTLGCPDIPEGFGADVTTMISSLAPEAERELKKSEYKKVDAERRFDMQRGKDADEVQDLIEKNHKLITGKKASPLNIAQYAAEYHALKKRQEGHGAIWRYFHKQENEDRNKLLEIMKNTLNFALGEGAGVDVDRLSPAEISDTVMAGKVKAAYSETAIAERNQMSADHFEHQPTTTERADKDVENPYKDVLFDGAFRQGLLIDRSLFKDIEPSTDVEGKTPIEKNAKEQKKPQEADLSDYNPTKLPMTRYKSQV